MSVRDRTHNVFVNFPFDDDYRSLFDAVVFALTFCGFNVRTALEITDSGQLRLEKIIGLIEQSRFSIHDLCRVELDGEHHLPRFNMPIELGIALGMKYLGRYSLRDHKMLILEHDRYRYQKFASDLAGVDISGHQSDPTRIIAKVRDFLSNHVDESLPTSRPILSAYQLFEKSLPEMTKLSMQHEEELTFRERLQHMNVFIERYAIE